MWQRWQNKQTPMISAPMQFTALDRDSQHGSSRSYDQGYDDYEYDERYLETIPEVDSISSRRQSVQATLPELPFRAVPPLIEIPQPVNIQRKPSLAAPQPTAAAQTSLTTMKNSGLKINAKGIDQSSASVSPVTPLGPHDALGPQHSLADDQPVSPIDDSTSGPLGSTAPARAPSQIPVLQKAWQAGDDSKVRTKWDEYSGEPTDDSRGKESSFRLSTQPVEMQFPHLKERTKQILAGLRERDSMNNNSKKPLWGKQPPPVAADILDNPSQREPWKGASGRTAIVDPVKNTSVPRKQITRHPQRNISLSHAMEPLNLSTAGLQGDQQPLPQQQQQQQQQQQIYEPHTHAEAASEQRQLLREKPSEEELRPVVPLKTRNLTPPGHSPVQSPVKLEFTQQSMPPQQKQDAVSANPRPDVKETRVESPTDVSEPTTPTTPIANAASLSLSEQPLPLSAFSQHSMDNDQSRFSWTTYTTSHADSTRSSAYELPGHHVATPPSMPSMPQIISIKKRAVTSSPFMHSSPSPYSHNNYRDSQASIVRKPVANQQNRSSSMTSTGQRTMSLSKTLPPTPTIEEAVDKIDNLDARIEALERRRHNIGRIIDGQRALLQKNAVIYDMWKRREVEKNIAQQQLEMDEIGREIHDLGMQLHRAQRKRDREDGYEKPTGLWIKRVTSEH